MRTGTQPAGSTPSAHRRLAEGREHLITIAATDADHARTIQSELSLAGGVWNGREYDGSVLQVADADVRYSLTQAPFDPPTPPPLPLLPQSLRQPPFLPPLPADFPLLALPPPQPPALNNAPSPVPRPMPPVAPWPLARPLPASAPLAPIAGAVASACILLLLCCCCLLLLKHKCLRVPSFSRAGAALARPGIRSGAPLAPSPRASPRVATKPSPRTQPSRRMPRLSLASNLWW